MHIICSLPRELNNLAKKLTVATRIMQNSSNEPSTPFSVAVKCKKMETFNTYTLNSLTYVGIADGRKAMLSS